MTFLVEDADVVQLLQRGHGGWSEDMFVALTRHVGRVVKVYPDNDIRVNVLGKEWTLNPACLKRAAPDHSVVPNHPAEIYEKCAGAVEGSQKWVRNLHFLLYLDQLLTDIQNSFFL